MNEKEKIVGGVLYLQQLFWLLGGLFIGAVVFVLLFFIIGKTALFFGFIFSLTGVPFAFYRKGDLTLFEYLTTKRSFDKKNKLLPNRRKID